MLKKIMKFKYILSLLLIISGISTLSNNNFRSFLFDKLNLDFFNSDSSELREFYYPNGNLESKQYYINNKKTGIWEFYYEDGGLKSTISFTFYSPHEEGNIINYDESGTIISTGKIIDGENVSVWKYYDENGKLNHSFDYDKGSIFIHDDKGKVSFSVGEDALVSRLREIQKEIRNDSDRSLQERNQ